jgi:hypothetical protein
VNVFLADIFCAVKLLIKSAKEPAGIKIQPQQQPIARDAVVMRSPFFYEFKAPPVFFTSLRAVCGAEKKAASACLSRTKAKAHTLAHGDK